jgi:hypothetical protein
MRIRKTLITALAVAIAIAFSPLPELAAWGGQPDPRRKDEEEEEGGEEGQEERQEEERQAGSQQGWQLRHVHVLEQEEQEVLGRAQQEVTRGLLLA